MACHVKVAIAPVNHLAKEYQWILYVYTCSGMLLGLYNVLCIFTDTDECAQETHNCTVRQNCQNTEGGFVCTCKNGYEPTADGSDCQGIYYCT